MPCINLRCPYTAQKHQGIPYFGDWLVWIIPGVLVWEHFSILSENVCQLSRTLCLWRVTVTARTWCLWRVTVTAASGCVVVKDRIRAAWAHPWLNNYLWSPSNKLSRMFANCPVLRDLLSRVFRDLVRMHRLFQGKLKVLLVVCSNSACATWMCSTSDIRWAYCGVPKLHMALPIVQ